MEKCIAPGQNCASVLRRRQHSSKRLAGNSREERAAGEGRSPGCGGKNERGLRTVSAKGCSESAAAGRVAGESDRRKRRQSKASAFYSAPTDSRQVQPVGCLSEWLRSRSRNGRSKFDPHNVLTDGKFPRKFESCSSRTVLFWPSGGLREKGGVSSFNFRSQRKASRAPSLSRTRLQLQKQAAPTLPFCASPAFFRRAILAFLVLPCSRRKQRGYFLRATGAPPATKPANSIRKKPLRRKPQSAGDSRDSKDGRR